MKNILKFFLVILALSLLMACGVKNVSTQETDSAVKEIIDTYHNKDVKKYRKVIGESFDWKTERAETAKEKKELEAEIAEDLKLLEKVDFDEFEKFEADNFTDYIYQGEIDGKRVNIHIVFRKVMLDEEDESKYEWVLDYTDVFRFPD